MNLWAAVLVAGLIGGCSAPQKDNGSDPADGDAPEDAPDPGPETEHDRLLRMAKTKRKECKIFMDEIEKHTTGGDEIVKFDDAARFRELATSRSDTAKKIRAMAATLDELVTLRERYAALHDEMAAALTGSAEAKTDPTRKKGVDLYRKLQKDRQPLLDEISNWCNAPVEEPGAETPAPAPS